MSRYFPCPGYYYLDQGKCISHTIAGHIVDIMHIVTFYSKIQKKNSGTYPINADQLSYAAICDSAR